MRRFNYILLGCLLFTSMAGMASHNVSSRLEYELLGNNTVRIRVITLTDPSAALVDRCEVNLEIWNAAATVKLADIVDIPRSNGPLTDPNFALTCPGNIPMGEYITSTIKRNVYETTYVLPGPSTYQVYFSDVSRIYNLNNITNSGSVSVLVSAQINGSNFALPNHSPVITTDTVLTACTIQPWLNRLDITDPDGDSLSFTLVPCRMYSPGVSPPANATGYASPGTFGGNFAVNAAGNITWLNATNLIGGYAYALRISEWRNGTFLGDLTYDAVVFVLTNNCVVGGLSTSISPALVAYPNPAEGMIFLNRQVDAIALYDLQGKLLRSGVASDRLAVEDLPNGIYVLRTLTEGESKSFKINVGK